MSTPPGPSGSSGLIENLAGVMDVMLGRASGLNRIDLSSEGFWWSFAGVAIAGLVDTAALSLLYDNLPNQNSVTESKIFYVLGHLVIALIAYALSLLALYLLCREPSEQNRFPTAVVVHNWAAPIVSAAFLPLFFISFIFNGSSGSGEAASLQSLVSVFWIGVLIFVGVRLIRIALDIPLPKAIAYFVLTTAVSLVCSQGLETIVGLIRPS